MKSKTLVHHHPPTPPSLNSEVHPSGHHVAQYNVDRRFSYDEPQSHGSNYGSPGPVLQEGIPQQHYRPPHLESHGPTELGLAIQYDGYSQHSNYYQEGQYNGLPHNQPMFSGSPPTPLSANEDDEASRRTRSGRTIAPSSSPKGVENPRPKATPRSRKAKAGKGEKPKTPKLTAPLSIMTKDMVNIPVRNMEEWVNRPAEVRRKEAEKRNGYITRPMNSFMLYRSAYAERTKQWCLQNNHQIVSSVSGESWPLEPPEVRERYNEYAKIERINHQNAHPTYKFSPSKAVTPARKRKNEFSDDEEPSDLEDAEWAPGHGRSRPKSARRLDRSIGYPVNNMHAEFYDRPYGSHSSGMHKPSWDMANEGRPMPMPIHNDLYNQYFQATIHPNMGMGAGVMEDMRMRRVDTPGASMHFSPGHQVLLGLPGGNAADLMQQLQSHAGTPLTDDGQVDPMLLAFDGPQHSLEPALAQHHSDFRNGHIGLLEREFDQESVQNYLGAAAQHEEYHPEQWQPDPTIAAMEQGSEFEKWMDDHAS